LKIDYQLLDNDKNRLDQKHITTDFDCRQKTQDTSKIHERNEEQFFDKRRDNGRKDNICFEEEWNQHLLQQKKEEDKKYLGRDHPHDIKKDQRQTKYSNKHLKLNSKLTKVIAFIFILSLLPGTNSRCIT
jgi:hypothetical protein